MKTFKDLMPLEQLSMEEALQIHGGDTPPAAGCVSLACPPTSAAVACSGTYTCVSNANAPAPNPNPNPPTPGEK